MSGWDRFYEAFYGSLYMAWHDGLDAASIHDLSAEEKLRAEEMLLESLNSGDSDWRIPVGLAELGSMAAVHLFKDMIGVAQGRGRINMALALWKAEQWDGALDAIASVLFGAPFWTDRLDAAIAMRHLSKTVPDDLLLRAIEHDPSDLVRHHAASSLLAIHGIIPLELSAESHPVTIQIMSEDAETRSAALAEIRRLVGISA